MGRDANFEAYVARVKQFKAAEQRIQLYANPAGGARADLLLPLQDLIDVWAPDLHLVREQPGELMKIFQHANSIGTTKRQATSGCLIRWASTA
jgi:hypothetical protein